MANKIKSTFEKEMEDVTFRKEFEEGYRNFLLSELLVEIMNENHKTVRGLAGEIGVSPSVIQKIRTGQQRDLKLKNLLGIAEACGYHLILEKDGQKIDIGNSIFA